VKVLHTIDGLAGGGSERWVWDLVRLADPGRAVHRVVPIHFDLGRFVYADRLRALGALAGRTVPAPAGFEDAAAGDGSLVPLPSETPRIPRLSQRVPGRLRPWATRLWHHGIVFPVAAGRLAREFARFRPDVIHAHTFHGLVAGLILGALAGRPLIHTVPSSFRHIRESGYRWVPELYSRHQSRIARFVTSYPSELQGIGVPDSRIIRVRGMADVEGMVPLRARRDEFRGRIRSGLGIDEPATLALSVGRLAPEKGLAYGIQALPTVVAAHPDLHWAILGEGPDRARLERLAEKLGVAGHVHFLGFVREPLPWYAAADLYLRTNVVEGDNLSSFQAMAAGLPVVGFDTGSETELVPKARHGLLTENRNPAALAHALGEVIAAPDRAELGRRGSDYAAAHLAMEGVVRTCEAAYQELAR
jgi:glycosyltransferase involved in cell wall biosynthesis